MNKWIIIANLVMGSMAAASGISYISQPEVSTQKTLFTPIKNKQQGKALPTLQKTKPAQVRLRRLLGPIQPQMTSRPGGGPQVSNLSFQVIGTIVGDTPDSCFVFISENGTQKTYQPGQTVQGVKIKNIHADHVEFQVAQKVQKKYIFHGEQSANKKADRGDRRNRRGRGRWGRRGRNDGRSRGDRESRRQRWQKRMEEMKKNNPERYKRMMEMRQRWQKMRKLRETNPEKYQQMRDQMRKEWRRRMEKRMEELKNTDPERYERMKRRMERWQNRGGRRGGGDRGRRGRGRDRGNGNNNNDNNKKKKSSGSFTSPL